MKENIHPLVSIIIPCYNQAQYVGEAIESALNQTYKNVEIVCINDGSTDGSPAVIKEYAEKYKNILFFDESVNRGVCVARNKAIAASKGEYILPLDADDRIEPGYVEKAAEVLFNYPKVGIVYCRADFFGVKNRAWKLEEFDKKKIVFENLIFNSSLFRRKDFEELGGYKECMKYGGEDWDLWLSFVEKGFEVYRIDEVLFHYRKVKDKTRTDTAVAFRDNINSTIFRNHMDLFLNNDDFYVRVFTNYSFLKRKYKKYKSIYVKFLVIIIFETLLVLFFIFKGI